MDRSAYMRLWREKNKNKDREYMAEWREANIEWIKEYRRDRYNKNKKKEKKSAVSWQKKNPYKFMLICKAAAANKRYPGKITYKDIETVINRDGKKCYWCKKDILEISDLTLEHLKPVNQIEHLTIACRNCNGSKLHLRNGRRPYKIQLSDVELKSILKWLEQNNIVTEIKKYYTVSNIERVSNAAF